MASIAELDPNDHGAVVEFCTARSIDLVVVGPEAPLVDGLADRLSAEGVAVFGPSRAAARLEGSKGFTKDLCQRAGIPTAPFARFDGAQAAKDHVRENGAPIVVKADGLAAGKGVTVAATIAQADAAIDACFSGAFGAAGAEVVVEALMVGEEASFFALSDGDHVLPLATAQDHKRVGEGDTGANTGGMGAYSPAPVMTEEMIERTLEAIVRPTVAALAEQGTPYRGVLYAGLMITADGPQLIEYNVRFGDPEAQVLLMRLESDLIEMMLATVEGRLEGLVPVWSEDAALTVVMAAQGYPAAYRSGSPIARTGRAEAEAGVTVFHAGTAMADGRLVSAGGRVLGVTAAAADIEAAQKLAYRAVDLIDWPGGFCRRDIGWRAIGRNDRSFLHPKNPTESPLP